mmetsp:Transcript_63396/g.163118  ORF Transcript_63396/g.163118 Transcript_63396/m.163118 type:complete len:260 (+) Transcript_63396:86-865(+)
MDDIGDNVPKTKLQPRRPGESIKVAETVLKRRDRNLKAAADRAASVARIRKQQRDYKKGKLRIIRAEKLVKNCLIRQNDRRRLKTLKKRGQPKMPQGRVIVAVRNGRLGGSREVKDTLRSLALTERHTLVFLPITEEITAKLHTCKPFLFWGRPTFKTVFNVIHKKALFRDPETPKEKKPLSDNVLIEKHLGDTGVLCTEDLAHVLYTRAQSFSEVNSRLWPVPLGDAKKTSGMVHEKKFTFGDLQAAVNLKISKLIAE